MGGGRETTVWREEGRMGSTGEVGRAKGEIWLGGAIGVGVRGMMVVSAYADVDTRRSVVMRSSGDRNAR